MIKKREVQYSALLRQLISQRHRGEIMITAIITVFFLSAVLICQYKCFEIEQANCKQAERQMVVAIRDTLDRRNDHSSNAAIADR